MCQVTPPLSIFYVLKVSHSVEPIKSVLNFSVNLLAFWGYFTVDKIYIAHESMANKAVF